MNTTRILGIALGESISCGGELLFSCPFCKTERKKFSVRVSKSAWKCWKCGSKGKGFVKLLNKINKPHLAKKFPKYEEQASLDLIFEDSIEQIIELPKSYTPISDEAPKPFLAYLEKRKISIDFARARCIGYSTWGKHQDRIIIPSFDENGDLNYYVSRIIYEVDQNKYHASYQKETFIFGEYSLDFDKQVYLVEGPFDHLVLENSIPMLGSRFDEYSLQMQRLIEKVNSVTLVFDGDVSLSKSKRTCDILYSLGMDVHYVILPDNKDVHDLYLEDNLEFIKNNSIHYKNQIQII